MNGKFLLVENKGFKDFNPLQFGHQHCESGHTFSYNNLNCYLIHYVVSGIGKFYTEEVEYNVNPGEMFIIKKGCSGRYAADIKNPWYYIWVAFDGELANNFSRISKPVLSLNTEIFMQMLESFNMNNMKEELLASFLFLLYREIFGEKEVENYVAKVKNHIDLNYMKNIKIEDIAKGLGLNRKYLAKIFKENTGISMRQYLMIAKMTNAKRLLSEGVNVSETAALLGYDDQFSFSKGFKRFYGYPPSKAKNKKNPL